MKSQFNQDLIKKEDRIKLYELSMQAAHNESQIVWDFSGIFAVTNAIIIGFIASNLDHMGSDNYVPFLLCIFGIFISLLWLLTFSRRWEWYRFRMLQVRQREPKDWNLNAGDGKNFSDGDTIKYGDEKRRVPLFAQIFRTDVVFYTLITLFIVIYLFLAVITKPF